MAYIVAIAGGSCAGKTTIARALAAQLRDRAIALVAEDDYYHCSTTIPGFDDRTYDFDAPSAKDHALLAAHLVLARRGEAFAKPLYDFTTHQRRPQSETVPPSEILILEGMHAFAADALRAAVDLAVYVEADETLRLERRLARDVPLRGRTHAGVRAQFDATVRPGHERWVAPQRERADLVLVSIGAAQEAEVHALTLADALAQRLSAGA
jgi:uridine kinase